MNPVFIIFMVIFLGLLLGRIRIKGISLDVAGVLVVAVLFGVFRSVCPVIHLFGYTFSFSSDTGTSIMSFLSALGTALFIATVGLESGFGLSSMKREAAAFFLLGAGGVFINYLLLLIIAALDGKMDFCLLRGVFCGAMTSTPGLAALSERGAAPSAAVGYGSAYMFGAIGVVLFAQLMSRNTVDVAIDPPTKRSVCGKGENRSGGFTAVVAVILLGCLAGEFRVPLIGFSLGNSGGILIAGILIGILLKKKRRERIVSKDLTASLRLLGLMLFFAGSGIPAGERLLSDIHVRSFLYGAVLTITPIFIGLYLSMVCTRSKKKSVCAVCGIMTSTPAMGVLLRKGYIAAEDMACYSIAYTGALLTMVICMRI